MKSQNKNKNTSLTLLLLAMVVLALPMATPALATVTSLTINSPKADPPGPVAYIRTIGTVGERTVAVNYTVVFTSTTGVWGRQIILMQGVGAPWETSTGMQAQLAPGALSLTPTETWEAVASTPEGLYNVRVNARQPNTGSPTSATNSNAIMVDNTAPTVPGTPSGSPNPNTGACTVTWDASSDPTSGGVSSGVADYELQRRYSSDGGSTWGSWSTIASPTTNSYGDSGLAEGLYEYQVRARDRANNFSDYSGTSDAVMVDKTAPTSTVSTPSDGDTICVGTLVSITGTADDPMSGGVASGVAEVVVTVDSTSLTVTGTTSWSAEWTPDTPGLYTITAVAVDSAGNVQDPVTSITVEVVECEECDWQPETAWAAGPGYIDASQWATYTPYIADSSVTLYAGQTMEAGTVHFSVPVDGSVTITITLNAGWRFREDITENVKIQDYETAPSGNPAPGQFDYKYNATGSPFTVPENNFYGVHVDVEREVCPE